MRVLQDIPRIYGIFFIVAVILALLMVWYTGAYKTGADTTELNEVILSAAVSEADQSSRLNQGSLLLADTFEMVVWENIKNSYEDGSVVQFEYKFDQSDPYFKNAPEGASSMEYVLPNVGPLPVTYTNGIPSARSYMVGKPIEHVRVKIRDKEDPIGQWTYVSTVTVDAVTR